MINPLKQAEHCWSSTKRPLAVSMFLPKLSETCCMHGGKRAHKQVCGAHSLAPCSPISICWRTLAVVDPQLLLTDKSSTAFEHNSHILRHCFLWF